MKPKFHHFFLFSAVVLIPIRLIAFVVDSAMVDFINWLGSHWDFVGQNYKVDPSYIVSVLVLSMALYYAKHGSFLSSGQPSV